jgi:pimeloyl-ACP methyl ester carboxylesterase
LDEDAQIALLEDVRKTQDQALATAEQHVAGLPGTLLCKTLSRNGSELRYYVGGNTGPTVILLNALGQGLQCWYRLIARLVESCRVITWEPRGTVSPTRPFGLSDQVDDLDAVVQSERLDSCHLVGWCTGPKVAIEYHLRRPSVIRSMAFLNGTFKCTSSPEEFDSPYEQNMESLCRMLIRKPSTAESVMKNLQSRPEDDELALLQGSDGEQISISVLSQINTDLKSYVLAPFRTEETILNYAHQLRDFWAHDVRPRAGEIPVPVLLMGAEYDQVATPASSQMAAGLFPNARHLHVTGATHYCLYDRAEFVAGLLTSFFANPDHLPVGSPVCDEVAQAR